MNNKGFTLIEVLLAVFITAVGVLALYNGISYSYNSMQKAKDKFTAAYLAQEGVEIVKSIRDSNYKAGNNWNSNLIGCLTSSYGCRADYNDYLLTANASEAESQIKLKTETGSFYSYDTGDDSIFTRKIELTSLSSNEILIQITVYWGDEEFLLEEIIYNWKNRAV
jgi:prepilin-type N-terminal cleavage/methylation domain-containing protein